MRLNDKAETTRKDKLLICKIPLRIYCKHIVVLI